MSQASPVELYDCVSVGTNKNSSACVQVWTNTCRPNGLLCLPRVAFWTDFEILGEAGDKNNLTSMPNYCDEPYRNFGIYAKKVSSAWTEVWSGLWP